MKKAILLALAVLFALPCAAQTAQPEDPDAVAIRDVMAKMGVAWANHDMKTWTSYMTDDVEWVNIVGMWWRGKDEVFLAHDAFHKTIFQGRKMGAPETVALRRVAPDAFVVNIVVMTGAFTSPSGVYRPAARNILTEVFVKKEGRWLLCAGQNTVIDEAAQKNNPVQKKETTP